MKSTPRADADELRPEYDLTKLRLRRVGPERQTPKSPRPTPVPAQYGTRRRRRLDPHASGRRAQESDPAARSSRPPSRAPRAAEIRHPISKNGANPPERRDPWPCSRSVGRTSF